MMSKEFGNVSEALFKRSVVILKRSKSIFRKILKGFRDFGQKGYFENDWI